MKAVDFKFPVEDARTGDVSRAPAIPPHFYLWYYLPSTYLLIATAIIQTEKGSKNGSDSPHTQGKCDFVCPLLSLLDGARHGSTSCKSGNHTCPVLSSSSSLHFAPASASSSPASVEQEQSPVPTLSSSGHPWEVGRPSSPLTVIHSTPHHSAGLRLPPAARHLPPAALAPSIRLPLLKL